MKRGKRNRIAKKLIPHIKSKMWCKQHKKKASLSMRQIQMDHMSEPRVKRV